MDAPVLLNKAVAEHDAAAHLRGAGTYNAETGEERLWVRVRVTLATRIPGQVCRAANLDYLDPDSIDLARLR